MDMARVLERYLGDRVITRETGRQLNETVSRHLAALFLRGESIVDLAEMRCSFIDLLLRRLHRQFSLDLTPDLAVVAVGGYGRRELHPFTDIDVLVLTRDPLTPEAGDRVGQFVTLLWDLKLDVGHAVRTVAECVSAGSSDLTIATNLLERRLICGSDETYRLLNSAVEDESFWPVKKFFRAKMEEQQRRHASLKNTMNRLEPDLKNMRGGLRDVQTIMWIARKFTGAVRPEELCQQGFTTPGELRDLLFSAYFLWKVRFALQFGCRRNDNRLTFDRQVAVARMLGYIGEGNTPVENLMISFYQNTRQIEEINHIILQRYEEAIFRDENPPRIRFLSASFLLRGTLLDLVDPTLFRRDPAAVMDLMETAADLNSRGDGQPVTGLHPDCVRSIRELKNTSRGQLEDDPRCRRSFLRILASGPGMLLPLKLMMRHGIMAMYMPEWVRLTGLMQFDMFHEYTVDEHTYRTVANIFAFTDPSCQEPSAGDPALNLFRDIYRNLPRQPLLCLAALLHDIGKGRRGGGHAQVGAEISERFCALHELPPAEARTVTWLVRHHIDFSNTAQRRDISDPNVIADFASLVGDENRLDYLYCLSVADICATNGTSWNSWKDALFRELYYATRRILRQDPEHPVDWKLQMEETRRTVMADLTAGGLPAEGIRKLWDTFDGSYFVRNTPPQIRRHTEHILGYGGGDLPVIVFGESVNRLGTELFIYMKDRLGIFSRIAALLSARRISVLSATILGSSDGFILDTFTVMDRNAQPLSPESFGPLKKYLMQNLISQDTPVPPVPEIPARYRQFNIRPSVSYLDIPGADQQGVTHLEVSALDRPGLLASIARVFQQEGMNILAARIATTGERADDGFTISLQGRSLNMEEKEELRQKLTAAVGTSRPQEKDTPEKAPPAAGRKEKPEG